MAGTVDDAVVCRWLARLYLSELDDEAIEAYASGMAAPILDHLAKDTKLVGHVESVRSAIAQWPEIEDIRLELAADFAALFLGDARAGAPVYASCYCGSEGELFQEPHDRMEARLRAIRLGIREDVREPADHLSIMLQYLAVRLEGEADVQVAEVPGEPCGRFIRNELLNWLPQFAQAAEPVRTTSEIYKGIIGLTVEYLRGLSSRTSLV